MPRDNRHEANARQSVRIGGRKVMSRGGIVGARPGRTSTEEKADALVAFADAASGYAGRQSAEMEQEQAKAQRLQAYKDFHEDGSGAAGATARRASAPSRPRKGQPFCEAYTLPWSGIEAKCGTEAGQDT